MGLGPGVVRADLLLRSYGLNVAQAGAITGRIHLIGGIIASLVAVWLMDQPFFMRDSRRVLAVLGWVTGCATVLSIIAFWTHSLALTTLMLWAFLPAIYFFIGPCMALVLNSRRATCARRSRPGRCWSATS